MKSVKKVLALLTITTIALCTFSIAVLGETSLSNENYYDETIALNGQIAVTKNTDEFTKHQTRTPTDLPLGQATFTTGEIVVSGQTISAPRPSVSHGVIMLPLRAIAEALELEVIWDELERRVSISENYVVWIDRPIISRDGGQSTQEFGPASIIIDDRTFVPISFFNFGMSGISANIVDGIVIVEWCE